METIHRTEISTTDKPNEGKMRKISIAIPTYNRVDMTIESFIDVYNDERISEIVIVDDASDCVLFTELKNICDKFPKVKLYRNLTNQDCYRNKMTAVSYVTNDWCILLDSDNHIDITYIDRLYDFGGWMRNTIYTPSFAMPVFDFRTFRSIEVSKENVANYIDKPLFETCLNASNFFINKSEYLKIWDGSIDPVTSDSIYLCYKWLDAGNKIYIVPELAYQHRVHDGSHYKNNINRTPPGFHQDILNKLKQLA